MNHRIKNNSRKKSVRRERAIMLVSSAFVMAALTMTGIYLKEASKKEQDQGYSLDLSELDNNVENKYQELAQNVDKDVKDLDIPGKETVFSDPQKTGDKTASVTPSAREKKVVLDEELDYMPREDSVIDDAPVTAVDSGLVEIPGLTEVTEEEVPERSHLFTEEEGLAVPVDGQVLMHFNMDNTVYFATLDQYKYNPAVIYQAEEGSSVLACADGEVINIYSNEELGQAMVLDLGSGYHVTYGQLGNMYVNVGDHVEAGATIATVAQPTKYYVTEGCNLYFSMEKDGQVINPEGLLP